MSVSVRHDLCLPRKCDYASCQERGEEASPDSSLPLVPNLARPPKQRKVETRKVETKSRDEKSRRKEERKRKLGARQCHAGNAMSSPVLSAGCLCAPLLPPFPLLPTRLSC